jgi:hypothetical protein
MLNGVSPLIIFNFSKNAGYIVENIPMLPDWAQKIPYPPIPIYLDPDLTGVHIESENKNIDLTTEVETLTSSEDKPEVNQRGLNSTVNINLIASKNSVGLTIILALLDQIFEKATSKEYSITYINGAVTVFGGLLHSFSVNQTSDNDMYNITIVLSMANSQGPKKKAEKVTRIGRTGTEEGL